MDKQTKTAVLFAGGKSSRMGKDKALLPFGNYSSLALLQHQKLCSLFDHVYISTKIDKFDFEANLLFDSKDTYSPLVALVTIFESLSCENLFILGVDMPHIHPSYISRLVKEHNKSYDVTVASSPRGLEPLCAVYSRAIIPKLKTALQNNHHKLTSLIKESTHNVVTFEDAEAFANINTPEQYLKATHSSNTLH